MRQQLIKIAAMAITLASMAGCATTFDTYPDALHACRLMQPGRTLRKVKLPATQPQVAACLERHGWSSDGRQISTASP